MELSLMYFATGEGDVAREKYRLIIESARFADVAGLRRIWLPERHFVPFGSLHPNPSVLAAALARETHRVRLAAGSVVLPLHNPLRVAEEWAVVDNLSGGRVDLAFASGWHPNDFALAPNRYDKRYDDLVQGIDSVKRLWRGETISVPSGNDKQICVRVYPTPIQNELPIWITAAKNPTTFRLAGQLGANVLTYLVDLGVKGLPECIASYRAGRAERGLAPDDGKVTVMLHTYVGPDCDAVKTKVRPYYLDYLHANADFLTGAASALTGRGSIYSLDEREITALAEHQFERVFGTLSFMGDVSSCLNLAHSLQEIGVTEIACLIDFVADAQVALDGLNELVRVRDRLSDLPDVTIASGAEETSGSLDQKTERWDPDQVQARLRYHMSGNDFYARLLKLGGEYGPSFQMIEGIWFDEGEALARLSPIKSGEGNDSSLGLKPTVLDNCLSTLIATSMTPIQQISGHAFGLPEGFQNLEVNEAPGGPLWSHAVRRVAPNGYYLGDVRVFDDAGQCVVTAGGLRFKRLRSENPQFNHSANPKTYSIVWDAVALDDVDHSAMQGQHWLICSDDHLMAEALAETLRLHGCHAAVFPLLRTISTHWPTVSEFDPQMVEQTLAQTIGAEINSCTGLIWLATAEGAADDGGQILVNRISLTLGLARAVENLSSTAALRQVCIVTRDAQMATPDQRRLNALGAAIWGSARSLADEQQRSYIRLIDVDAETNYKLLTEKLTTLISVAGVRREFALRKGHCLSPRLLPVEAATVSEQEFYPRQDRAYLVTGGSGGIGLTLATWLAARGARDIVLFGRTDLENYDSVRREQISHTFAMLERLGARVYRRTVDVADLTELRTGLDSVFADGCPPLAGIFHLAGVTRDAPFQKITSETIRETLRPKTLGTDWLNQLADDLDLDLFITFSSVAAVVGSFGQTIYAAANAYMDAVMLQRRLRNKPGGTINWGPWGGAGMAERGRVSDRISSIGLEPLDVQEALVALSLSLSNQWPQIVIGAPVWERLRQHRNGSAASPMLEEFFKAGSENTVKEVEPVNNHLVNLLALSPAEQQRFVETEVIRIIAEAMQINPAELSPSDDLMGLNLSSLEAMELRSTMQSQYGVTIPISVFLQARTIADLTTEVLSNLLVSVITSDTYAHRDKLSGDVVEL